MEKQNRTRKPRVERNWEPQRTADGKLLLSFWVSRSPRENEK